VRKTSGLLHCEHNGCVLGEVSGGGRIVTICRPAGVPGAVGVLGAGVEATGVAAGFAELGATDYCTSGNDDKSEETQQPQGVWLAGGASAGEPR
jgi:hypothetical protein